MTDVQAVGPLLTSTQIKSARAIVNLFETGTVRGDYGQVTLIEGDTGHLTYGRSQTTLGSGNLATLLQRYCANHGARFGPRLVESLPRFAKRDLTLDADARLQNVLRACADDPVMRDTQDAFFEDAYWRPAYATAGKLGIVSPLGVAVVYDSSVHGSWAPIRDKAVAAVGTVQSAGEKAWIQAYVSARRNWMATNKRPDLRATVYRMDAFQRLIDQGFWGLALPLVVRGQEISMATLSATPPGCYDGPLPGSRVLAVQSPLARGLDVRLLQLGLSDLGADIKADGVFGQASFKCVRQYQAAHALPATGIADVPLIAEIVN